MVNLEKNIYLDINHGGGEKFKKMIAKNFNFFYLQASKIYILFKLFKYKI